MHANNAPGILFVQAFTAVPAMSRLGASFSSLVLFKTIDLERDL